MRGAEIHKRPVVTLEGEDIAQIKDIVYTGGEGQVAGFTLNGRGMWSGPLKEGLAWSHMMALGPDAVIVESVDSLEPLSDLKQRAEPAGGDVLGSRVLTDKGEDLGEVVDVVIRVADGTDAKLVGYQVRPEDHGRRDDPLFVPLPNTLAASGEHLVVPAAAKDFVGHDLAGFEESVEQFRRLLDERDR